MKTLLCVIIGSMLCVEALGSVDTNTISRFPDDLFKTFSICTLNKCISRWTNSIISFSIFFNLLCNKSFWRNKMRGDITLAQDNPTESSKTEDRLHVHNSTG